MRNGSTREPSEVVPSGNSSRLSPAASRSRIASRSRPVASRWRETKTVRPSRATVPTSGQRPTSSFDTKQASSRPPSTGTSSQDEWLETNTTGRASGPLAERADHPHPKPEQAADHRPVEPCEHHLGAARQQQADRLDHHAGQRPQQHAERRAARPAAGGASPRRAARQSARHRMLPAQPGRASIGRRAPRRRGDGDVSLIMDAG